MSGLYQRALYFLNQSGLVSTRKEEIEEAEGKSNISPDEQKEILAQIENLVSRNKIAITDESFVLKAKKNGVFLPAIINCLAIVLVVSSFFLFQSISLSQEKKIYLDAGSSAGVLDSQVISSMKKRSEEQLSAKEREISQIQNQLRSLDEEKNLLATNMEQEVESKKADLEKQMQLELEKQRQELASKGIATADIESQLAEIKKQKEIEFSKSFDEFRSKAEAQRIDDEKKLSALQESFNKNLSSLSSEKQSLQEQIKSQGTQLDELRKKNAERESQLTEEKKSAEARLKEMTDMRDREQLVNDQITGLYNRIMSAMREGNYAGAQNSIDEMKGFFKDPQVVALPGILKRRDTELFITDSLENLIQSSISKQEFDASGILQKAGLITSISKKVEEADNMYRRSDFDGAKKMYEEALSVIPEVRKSYTQADSIDIATLNARFDNLKKAGDGFFRNRNYASALEQYARALKAFPGDQDKVDEVVSRIIEAGNRAGGNLGINPEDERSAALLVGRAETNLTLNKYPEAIDSYIEVISKYPRSTYVQVAALGISNSASGERNFLLSQQDTALAAKNSMITERDNAITQLSALIEKNNSALAEKDVKIIELTASLEKKGAIPYDAGSNVSQLNSEIEKYKSQIKEKDATIAGITRTIEINKTGLAEKDTLISRLSSENEKYKSLINEKDDTIKRLNATIEKGTVTNTDRDAIAAQLNAELDKYKALSKEKDDTILILNVSLIESRNFKETSQKELDRLKLVEIDLNKKISQLEEDKAALGKELALLKEKSPVAATSPQPEPTSGAAISDSSGATPVPESDAATEAIVADYNALKAKIDDLKKLYGNYAQREDAILKDKGTVGYLTTKPLLGEMLNSQFARELFPDLYERIKHFDSALSTDERAYGREKGIEEAIDVVNNRLLLSRDKKPDEYWKQIRQAYKNDDTFLDLVDMLEEMIEK